MPEHAHRASHRRHFATVFSLTGWLCMYIMCVHECRQHSKCGIVVPHFALCTININMIINIIDRHNAAAAAVDDADNDDDVDDMRIRLQRIIGLTASTHTDVHKLNKSTHAYYTFVLGAHTMKIWIPLCVPKNIPTESVAHCGTYTHTHHKFPHSMCARMLISCGRMMFNMFLGILWKNLAE